MSTCKFPSQESYIRDAVNGIYTSYRIGSQDEIRFWKIVRSDSSLHKEMIKCFYSSPEAYEKDLKLKVGETEKCLWYADQESYKELELELSSLK